MSFMYPTHDLHYANQSPHFDLPRERDEDNYEDLLLLGTDHLFDDPEEVDDEDEDDDEDEYDDEDWDDPWDDEEEELTTQDWI